MSRLRPRRTFHEGSYYDLLPVDGVSALQNPGFAEVGSGSRLKGSQRAHLVRSDSRPNRDGLARHVEVIPRRAGFSALCEVGRVSLRQTWARRGTHYASHGNRLVCSQLKGSQSKKTDDGRGKPQGQASIQCTQAALRFATAPMYDNVLYLIRMPPGPKGSADH
jgi:hypothetical protein